MEALSPHARSNRPISADSPKGCLQLMLRASATWWQCGAIQVTAAAVACRLTAADVIEKNI